ncbi:MAG: hypothetical protein GX267_03575 [Fibrobacter sp.]|jgi:hypothetical protein|nr:hypothetical protein [Fibrobacter sp.]
MEVHISIGPLRVTISFPAGYIELSRSLSLFETSFSDVEYFLEVREKDNLIIPANAVSRRDHYFMEHSLCDLCFGNSHFSLRIDFVKKSAVLTVKSDFGDKRLLLFNAFKWFLSLITIDNGGVPLHSSNMIRNNKALLFCGMSGSGKSTISRLLSDRKTWQRGSDELNLVFFQDSEPYAYATPYFSFDSELRMSGASLKHLFFLRHSPRNHTQTLYGKEIYWNILKNIYTIPANDTMAEKMYNNVEFLSESVKCSTLYFINNQSVKQFIEDWMDNQYV